jgi:hypothetical protein
MAEHAVVVAAATYRSRAAATRDLRALCHEASAGGQTSVAAAVLEKGAEGRLTVDHLGSSPSPSRADGHDVLLGAVLVVLAAPLGIHFLVPLVASASAWSGVASLAGHLWHDVPRDQLRRMSALLEGEQAALVAVAVDRSGEEVRAALAGAGTAVVTDAVLLDIEAELALAIGEANADPSPAAPT